MNNTKIHIDPRTNIEYASFYISGLYSIFGRKHVKFYKKPFKNLKGFEHFLALTITDNNEVKHIIIDFTDTKTINNEALQWSHVYGKINLTQEDANSSKKIIPIGPSFGIKIYNRWETLFYGISNFIKSFKDLKRKKFFLSSYWAQFKRPTLLNYAPSASQQNYIFFLSSLWKKEFETNMYRANFITACKSLKEISFQGGFVPRRYNDIQGFEHITIDKRLSTTSYFQKFKRSILAFNTPAVKACHGWKLAEYLALGKAILSTPLSRILPEPLKDGELLILTDGTIEDISEKVKYLISNPDFRVKLETRARTYYEAYLQPTVVINHLVNFTITASE